MQGGRGWCCGRGWCLQGVLYEELMLVQGGREGTSACVRWEGGASEGLMLVQGGREELVRD